MENISLPFSIHYENKYRTTYINEVKIIMMVSSFSIAIISHKGLMLQSPTGVRFISAQCVWRAPCAISRLHSSRATSTLVGHIHCNCSTLYVSVTGNGPPFALIMNTTKTSSLLCGNLSFSADQMGD